MGAPALAPYVDAVEEADGALVQAEAGATLAETTLSGAADAVEAARGRAIEGARRVRMVLELLRGEEVDGAVMLFEIAEQAWSPADRRLRGASSLPSLRRLVDALTLAAPSAAGAQVAEARERLGADTAAFAAAWEAREAARREQAAAWRGRQEADGRVRAALRDLRRAVALALGGEATEAYQRWRAPVARLGGTGRAAANGGA